MKRAKAKSVGSEGKKIKKKNANERDSENEGCTIEKGKTKMHVCCFLSCICVSSMDLSLESNTFCEITQ